MITFSPYAMRAEDQNIPPLLPFSKYSSFSFLSSLLNSLIEKEIYLIVLLQQTLSPTFDSLAIIFHYALSEEFVMLLAPLMTWTVSYDKGWQCAVLLSSVEIINGLVKWCLRLPRPIWSSSLINNIKGSWESDYSTPSGHSMLVSATYLFYLHYYSSTALIIGGGIIVTLVGLSRVYIGVHYPHDIVFGWFLSSITTTLFFSLNDLLSSSLVLKTICGMSWSIISFLSFVSVCKLFPPETEAQLQMWETRALNAFEMWEKYKHVDHAVHQKKVRKLTPRKVERYLVQFAGQMSTAIAYPLIKLTLTEEEVSCTEIQTCAMRLLIGILVGAVFLLPPLHFLKHSTSRHKNLIELLCFFGFGFWVYCASFWLFKLIGM